MIQCGIKTFKTPEMMMRDNFLHFYTFGIKINLCTPVRVGQSVR